MAAPGASLGRLTDAPLRACLRELRARLEGTAARLESVSPLAVLQRGYALVSDPAGHPLTIGGCGGARARGCGCASPMARWRPPRRDARPQATVAAQGRLPDLNPGVTCLQCVRACYRAATMR